MGFHAASFQEHEMRVCNRSSSKYQGNLPHLWMVNADDGGINWAFTESSCARSTRLTWRSHSTRRRATSHPACARPRSSTCRLRQHALFHRTSTMHQDAVQFVEPTSEIRQEHLCAATAQYAGRQRLVLADRASRRRFFADRSWEDHVLKNFPSPITKSKHCLAAVS